MKPKDYTITINDVENLAEQIKKGNISVEDFSRYYATKIGAKEISPELLKNLKNNFEFINKGERESINAKRAIQIMLERIRQRK